MLKKILSGSVCADCRLCCVFDRYDIWETPLFEEETTAKIKAAFPDAKFAKKGGGFVLTSGEITDGELFSCPALTDSGCMLGDDKPFDCRIWPFRIMNGSGQRVIAVSSLCSAVYEQSHDKLRSFLKEELAEKIFDYADKFPEAVHELYDNYTVLLNENEL